MLKCRRSLASLLGCQLLPSVPLIGPHSTDCTEAAIASFRYFASEPSQSAEPPQRQRKSQQQPQYKSEGQTAGGRPTENRSGSSRPKFSQKAADQSSDRSRQQGARGGSGSSSPPALKVEHGGALATHERAGDSLAMQNAPRQVFELIGDPRSGVSDDVTTNPFGELTVDMIHHQLSNEVYWYKYEFAGNLMKESHRDARLSDYSKNLMYILRAKDPERWTIPALALKFHIRKQRVLAILALKEMEAHRMEQGQMLPGPLSAYACPVYLDHVKLHPTTEELIEFNMPAAMDAATSAASGNSASTSAAAAAQAKQLQGGQEAAAGEAGRSEQQYDAADNDIGLDDDLAEFTTSSSVRRKRAAVVPAHWFDLAAARTQVAQQAQAVQRELLSMLKPFGYDVSAVEAHVMAQVEQCQAALQQAAPAGDPADGTAAAASDAGAGAGLPALKQQLQAALQAAAAVLGTSEALQDERRLLQMAQQVGQLLEAGAGAGAAAPPAAGDTAAAGADAGAADAGSQPSPELLAALQGWEGGMLLRLVLALPVHQRQALLQSVPKVSIALNGMGIDLTALTTRDDYSGPASTAANAAHSTSTSLLPLDVFGFKHIPESMHDAVAKALAELTQGLEGLEQQVHELSGSDQDRKQQGLSRDPAIGPAELQQLRQLLQAYLSADTMVAKLQQQPQEQQHRQQQQQQQRYVALSEEEKVKMLQLLQEVDPSYPARAEQFEAVMQLTASGQHEAAQQLLAEMGASGTAAAAAVPAAPALAGDASSGLTADAAKQYGKQGWDLVSAYLDVHVANKIYNRGSGERHLVRMASYPTFEGYSLSEFDQLKEGELSTLNRLVSEREEQQLYDRFRHNLLFNLGLRGDALWDASRPRPALNLNSLLDRPMVVYDIAQDGSTVYPPLYVVAPDGSKRPLNEQERVFQERRQASKARTTSYQFQNIKRKADLE